MAKSLGITFQQVQKYEHGVNRVSAGRLVAISKCLEVPISYFYAGLDNGGSGEADWMVASPPNAGGYEEENKKDPEEQKQRRLMMRDIELMVKAFRKIRDVETRRNFINIVSKVSEK